MAFFPTGGRDFNSTRAYHNNPAANLGDCCNSRDRAGWNWTYWILPYLEQSTVFDLASDAGDPAIGETGTSNTAQDIVAQQAIVTYYCPSRRMPMPMGSGFYRHDYAGNATLRGEPIPDAKIRLHPVAPSGDGSLVHAPSGVVDGPKSSGLAEESAFCVRMKNRQQRKERYWSWERASCVWSW